MATSDGELKNELNIQIAGLYAQAGKKRGTGGVVRHLKLAQMAVIRRNFQKARDEIAEAERQLNDLE